jgi:hypothetical protein
MTGENRLEMQKKRRRPGALGLWLGVLALTLNALAPIQLAFGMALTLADARQCGHRESAAAELHGPGRWAIAVLTAGSSVKEPFQSHKGLHPVTGAVCSLVAAPTGFIASSPAVMPLPALSFGVHLRPTAAEISAQAAHSDYRSRAPPVEPADSAL